MTRQTTRRRFLAKTALGGAGLLILPSSLAARTYRANEKLNVALVGVGGRGSWFVGAIPRIRENVVATCDPASSLPAGLVVVSRAGYSSSPSAARRTMTCCRALTLLTPAKPAADASAVCPRGTRGTGPSIVLRPLAVPGAIIVFLACAFCLRADEPINVGTRKQLFVGDHIVESTDNAFRILNQPVKHEGNPILELKPSQGVEGKELVMVSGSVLYDREDRLFKMWYEGANYRWTHNVVGYATSRDGIHWELPRLGLVEYSGSKANNVVFERGRGEMAPGVFKDPVAADPARRYKMIYNRGDGVGIAFSPDGIHWTPAAGEPVIAVSDSPNSALWDGRLRKYVAHTRHNARDAKGNLQRQVLQSESDDFVRWQRIGVVMQPDEQDPPWSRQFYCMEWMPYGDVYFGFPAVYHVLPGMEPKITPGAAWMDRVDVQLTFSRDGRHWMRAGDRQTFLPYGTRPDDFDRGMVFVMQHPIPVGDEIWIYYVGFRGRHWFLHRGEIQGGAVGLAKLRLDGFVSIDAGQGTLTTRPLTMSGDRLVVNADASLGSIRIEILDDHGQPLLGFAKQAADPITTDNVRHVATWQSNPDVADLNGKPIKLRFHLDRSKLYSFTFRSGLERSEPELACGLPGRAGGDLELQLLRPAGRAPAVGQRRHAVRSPPRVRSGGLQGAEQPASRPGPAPPVPRRLVVVRLTHEIVVGAQE